MGLVDKTHKVSSTSNKLTLQEYEFLFAMIKNSMFKGEQLELVYTLVAKLQEEYFLLKEKGSN